MHVPIVIGISPFEHPDAGLVAALSRAGALGVLDLGRDVRKAEAALAELTARVPSGFGVRIPAGVDVSALPNEARVVVLPAGTPFARWKDRTVLVQVTSIAEARAALAHGAAGLIAKGSEAGGPIGDEPSFILLQRIVREVSAPVWAQGGVGLHTSAACIVAGARGVVLDSQLALLKESAISPDVRRAIEAMDGSETHVVDRRRMYISRVANAELDGLPVGQDGAFAKGLAERCKSAGPFVRALEQAMVGHLRQARALKPLAPHSPFAAQHGITYPIVQGPMTRVSDRPAFADAVSTAGGLPFLALSLMRGEEARTLLAETAARHRGRTWGVGILAFVPDEIKNEQLALVLEARPTVAIVAGGRPSQARPLEDAGIATYLHVPSPGLLDLFLSDGGRRFVFEGRECGGHVGPRSSFILWESAIERLLASDFVRDVSVLFAGGVHDARSAAMISAMAAPLAARGAKVGVLMGTAYLFTEEAVATGAILPGFQEEAMRCERTVLLETAPGHATRCADTEYVRAFESERRRLEKEGKSRQEIWMALEQLNLGRLRIASKGLQRSGERMHHVDEGHQRREGMFMIGQVAALRSARCTIEELHRDVSEGATLELERMAPPSPKAAHGVDIAIIGMACVFPGAPDLATFWKNIVLGENAIREVPKERWNPEAYYDPAGTGDKTPSKWGGFLPDMVFDPTAFGIPPRSLAAIDPAQLLSLEVARRAMADAGYLDRDVDRERTSVIFGAEAGTELGGGYGFRASYRQLLGEMPSELDRHLPKLTEDSFPGVLANVIAGRIANRLDLGGKNYTVDAACASSLAAIDLACKELATGTSDMVIGGGADLHNGINDYLLFASVHALSPTGQCRTFDSSADGIVLGEGVAAVVLKRLADAERDGDRVYAVIKGVGGSSDGKNLALTAPRKEGQMRALERAYEAANVSPADVGLVEAHGTGTVVGDKTELATLTEFFASSGSLARACAIGSVKSNIGHTKCAAGLAGLIKAALAIHHGVLPPTLNIQSPNAAWDGASSPFAFHRGASPWVSASRVAGVSAFGFGGTNFHAVLASHGEQAKTGHDEWPSELFVFRAADRAGAEQTMRALAERLASPGTERLRDLAHAVAKRGDGPVQVAIVARTIDDLREKLTATKREGVFFAGEPQGRVAFLFPGQGSQRPGMLADLFVAFPELRDLLRLGEKWTPHLFPPAAFSDEERAAQKAAITDTRVAQPTLGVVELAMSRILARCGVRPSMVAGHSYGELVALAVAGALPEQDVLRLSEARAEAILAAAGGSPGTMAAVGASARAVRDALDGVDGITLANHNAPEQVVIAGSDEAIARAMDRLAELGISARKIPVACAFHSTIVASASETFARTLASVAIAEPALDVFANTTAEPYPHNPSAIRWQLARQLALPVRFAEQIEAMYEAGARVFVEAGPGGVLGDLVSRILRGKPHHAISCDRPGVHGLEALLMALAELASLGIDVNENALFEARDVRPVDLDVPRASAPKSAWIVNGWSARPLHGELPDHALRIPAVPLASATATAPPNDREATMIEYLRGMREMVETQRQVMLRYLGEAAPAAPARAPAPVALAAAPTSAPPPSPSSDVTPLEALIAIVSQRTGYPPEMLDPDLDLEADLGIDSIKRIEILGAMRDRLGLASMSDAVRSEALEELARFKTLRKIAAWVDARTGQTPPPPSQTHAPPSVSGVVPAIPSEQQVGRYVIEHTPSPLEASDVELDGRAFALIGDAHGVGRELATLLEARGARARVLALGESIDDADGIVFLASLAMDSSESTRHLFAVAKDAMKSGARWLIAAAHGGGGIAGLLKTVAKERPSLRACAIDVRKDAEATEIAQNVLAEILASTEDVEVTYTRGVRHVPRILERAIPADAHFALDRDAVVVITGGGRGITAEVAVALARRFGCRLELVGRTPIGDVEDAELARAEDALAIRKLLLERTNGAGRASPAAIEQACRAILGTREIRRTLARIEEAGGRAAYHAIDVRDTNALTSLIDAIYDRHGRIDGCIHGAGVIEDRLIADKTHESFARVFDTKVASARALVGRLRPDARFIVFFSSVAGAFGNRGQSDYAAANDALDKLAHELRARTDARILSVNWGPWGGVGMVSAELAREYERRGVGTITPELGVERFLDELCRGDATQVILASANASGWG